MIFSENWPLILAAAAVGLAAAQWLHLIALRIPAGLMLVIAALLALRWVIRRQARKSARMTQDVPKRPLGISDE